MVKVNKEKSEAKSRPSKKKEEVIYEDDASDIHDLEPVELHVVPKDQVKDLSDEQLNEEFTKALNANDPKAHSNMVHFVFKKGEFELEASVDQLAVHFLMEETLVHAESADALGRGEEVTITEGSANEEQKADDPSAADGEKIEELQPLVEEISASAPASPSSRGKALKNQFNFSERASQSFNNPQRDRMVTTEPPPTHDFEGQCDQFHIFDAYLAQLRDLKSAKASREKSAARSSKRDEGIDDDPTADLILAEPDEQVDGGTRVMASDSMKRSMKIMERTVNLNSDDDIFHDFKYFDDESDETREDGSGMFLPLWRFHYSAAQNKTVTAIKWNPHYPDLFAVSYGSYNFMKQQGGGLICCFSLKNTAFPEFSFTTGSGVMSIDFHPQHPALLAVGLYDGTVAVYDVRCKDNQPIYKSMDPKVKHTDPVWQVHWQEEDLAKDINFYSVSSDGRVTNWIMSKNELINEEVMELKLVPRKEEELEDDSSLVGLSGGTCFDFNRASDHIFVVGTDEGALHKCSKAYNSQYLETYKGHHMAVYAVKWNPFHPRVFLSCSADWTVQVWEASKNKSLLSFDLGTSVGDVSWAPYSSTVFAVVTSDGKVYVFDLNVNKRGPIAQQRIVKKGKLTHVEFNPIEPIILAGDDRGGVMSLKLSPNLRVISAKKKKDIDPEVEQQKMERIITIASKEEH